MIRISIDLPEGYKYRFQPVVAAQDVFLEREMLVDYGLRNPDLRVVHNDIALEELENSATGRLSTPVIVYERVDSAVILNNKLVRELMAHPDVKFWLKRNSYRDYQLNNRNFLLGRLHYKMLNDLPKFHMGPTDGETVLAPVTAEMAAKVRPLPIAAIERFAAFRDASINWSEKRPIDVNFAGLLDYEVRGTDFWDGAYENSLATESLPFEAVINEHRREAVRQLVEMKHLRVFLGLNRAVQSDIYLTAMLRSSIAVSPWGLGEYSYRDYEAVLAGAVLVKPHSDHIVTYAPDIYQANKYYVPCAPDFSDLREVIGSVLGDRARSLAIARAARDDMLAASSTARIVDYFSALFDEALGRSPPHPAERFPRIQPFRAPLLGIGKTLVGAARGSLQKRPTEGSIAGIDDVFVFAEDQTGNSSHDVRLSKNDVFVAGLYRLRCFLRRTGRRHFALQVHLNWKDSVSFGVDCDRKELAYSQTKGTDFTIVQPPKLVFGQDHRVAVSAFIRINRTLIGELFAVLYAAEEGRKVYYDGMGEDCFEIAALDFDSMESF